ncbi:MAG: hypothetical protein JSW64_10620 [Candidatus Zixiibacteriota bacterium]|nr:MAG: hypothetical protein JSW64_10620 [candidate division Zixibacteria bacterium]
MKEKSEKSLKMAGELHKMVREMIPQAGDLDLQRLLKQIEADVMDLEHKLSMAIKLSSRE